MKLVVISDTHTQHMKLAIPDGDVLIHCGDATMRGSMEEVSGFAEWFMSLPHKLKLFTPGNHDALFQSHRALSESMLAGVEILSDRAFRYGGLLFYGSPWTRKFMNWSFMADEAKLARYFELIPEQQQVDVLITHGPPHGVLDGNPVTIIGHPGASVTERSGSEALGDRVMRIKPRIHVFGHIHSGYGTVGNPATTFYNAAICNDAYEPVNAPHVIEIEPREVTK